MDEYSKYDALASTIQFKNITSDKAKQTILRRLKDNDPEFTTLFICNQDQIDDDFDFCPINGEELGWLGYFIGKNTTLNELGISSTPSPSCNAGVEGFRRGLAGNNSIRRISLCRHRLEGSVFELLDLFLKSNHNLTEIEVSECELNVDSVRQLSLALGNCKRSLKKVEFDDNNFGDGQLVDVIAALSMHNQLEHLDLEGMDVGRSECMALSTLLQNTTKQLQTLNLSINNIDDERIEVLVHGISGSKLQELDLSYNPSITIKGWKTESGLNLLYNRSITIRGWKALSSLLEMPNSNLERLILSHNNIGDEGALGGTIFCKCADEQQRTKSIDSA